MNRMNLHGESCRNLATATSPTPASALTWAGVADVLNDALQT
jgi:hypothetical protein